MATWPVAAFPAAVSPIQYTPGAARMKESTWTRPSAAMELLPKSMCGLRPGSASDSAAAPVTSTRSHSWRCGAAPPPAAGLQDTPALSTATTRPSRRSTPSSARRSVARRWFGGSPPRRMAVPKSVTQLPHSSASAAANSMPTYPAPTTATESGLPAAKRVRKASASERVVNACAVPASTAAARPGICLDSGWNNWPGETTAASNLNFSSSPEALSLRTAHRRRQSIMPAWPCL
mmetsp:Transcript_123392/g.360290  ORF Transcript_123392/g.360290 Transcript_123392/m.360290 type:complete len:234 (-) Transcript_123392:113-814(-)